MLGEVLQGVRAAVRQVSEEIGGDGKYFCIAAVSNGKLYDAPCNAALRASRAFHSVLPARHRQPPFMQQWGTLA